MVDLLDRAKAWLRGPARPSLGAAPRGPDALIKGRWYRVFSRVSENRIQAARASAPPSASPQIAAQNAVSDLVSYAGFDVRTSTEDPFRLGTWTTIGRYKIERNHLGALPDGLQIFDIREVEAPPDVLPRVDPAETGLDPGMTPGMVAVIRYALEDEHDPRRLDGMARSFDVDFPVSATVLRNKARVEGYARLYNHRVAKRYGPGPNQAVIGAVLHDMGEEARFTLEALEASVSGPALGYRARHGFREHAPVLATCDGLLGSGSDGGSDSVEVRLDLIPSLDVSPRDLKLGFGEACRVISDDDTVLGEPDRLAEALSACDVAFRPEVVALAVASMSPLGANLCIARPEVVTACLREGPIPVPRAALQLAHALERPEGSLVDMPRELSKEMKDLRAAAGAGDPEAVRALYEVKRARRVLDREAWADHVARVGRAERAQARRSG